MAADERARDSPAYYAHSFAKWVKIRNPLLKRQITIAAAVLCQHLQNSSKIELVTFTAHVLSSQVRINGCLL
ncbi:hypothetical protein WN943_028556 [Citrus x changshan-huyou]